MKMIVTRRLLAGLCAGLALPARAARAEDADLLTLAQIAELTGGGALAGDAWRSGTELAVREINAAGGLLGRQVRVVTYDAQSTAAGGRVAMQRALDLDPLAVLGPALSDTARGVLAAPRGRGVAVILGGGAADLTGPGHPDTFRAVPSAPAMMARLAGWLREQGTVTRVAILAADRDMPRAGREALARELRARGIEAGTEASGDPAADMAKLLKTAPDRLIVLLPPEAAGRAMIAARRLAPGLPVLGDAALVSPRSLAIAGDAAEGAAAHVLLPPEPDSGLPAGFFARYAAADKAPPEPLALAGYLAVGMVAAGLGIAGAADPLALARALRGLSVTGASAPMLLGDCAWNANGDPDRASWIVEIRGGEARGVRALRDAA